jgi:hypothetical protein
MAGGSYPWLLPGLALIFVFFLLASKHHLRRGEIKQRGSKMKKKHSDSSNTNLLMTTLEVFYDFSVSFGAGYLGGAIPSTRPLRSSAQRLVSFAK